MVRTIPVATGPTRPSRSRVPSPPSSWASPRQPPPPRCRPPIITVSQPTSPSSYPSSPFSYEFHPVTNPLPACRPLLLVRCRPVRTSARRGRRTGPDPPTGAHASTGEAPCDRPRHRRHPTPHRPDPRIPSSGIPAPGTQHRFIPEVSASIPNSSPPAMASFVGTYERPARSPNPKPQRHIATGRRESLPASERRLGDARSAGAWPARPIRSPSPHQLDASSGVSFPTTGPAPRVRDRPHFHPTQPRTHPFIPQREHGHPLSGGNVVRPAR